MNRSIAWIMVGLLMIALAGCAGESKEAGTGKTKGKKGKLASSAPAAPPAGSAAREAARDAAADAAENTPPGAAAPPVAQNSAPPNAAAPAVPAVATPQGGAAIAAPGDPQAASAPPVSFSLQIGNSDDEESTPAPVAQPQPVAAPIATPGANNQTKGRSAAKIAGAARGAGPPAAGAPVPAAPPTKVSTPQDALAVFSLQVLSRIQLRMAQEKVPALLPNIGNGTGQPAAAKGNAAKTQGGNGTGVFELQIGN